MRAGKQLLAELRLHHPLTKGFIREHFFCIGMRSVELALCILPGAE